MADISADVVRLAVFADAPGGGNPAGVWFGDRFPDEALMQAIAAAVGYSETAFVVPQRGRKRTIRYFSPQTEVPFCGHATIATGVLLGRTDGAGHFRLETPAGTVELDVVRSEDAFDVAMQSVEPAGRALDDALLDELIGVLNVDRGELDSAMPAAVAFAGAWHPIIALADRATLAALDYDFDALGALMRREAWLTAQVICRERCDLFHARNPAPAAGLVEDPATGSAAAALGGYLRRQGLVTPPQRLTVLQGYDMGRPSRLLVDVPATGGIVVTGSAIDI